MDFKEAVEKYGDVKLKFRSYYKYSFSFYGENDEVNIFASYGGNADDIYRYDVAADNEVTINGEFNYILIKDKEDNIIFEKYDY